MVTRYIKKGFKGFDFDPTLKQCFQNKFIANATMERDVVRKKMSNDISDQDVYVTAFVYEHILATADMLADICGISSKDRNEFEKHLNKLVLYRVLNRFFLCDDDKNRDFPDDALYIYTLDMGGKYLLEHYWKNNVDLWNSGTAGLCPEKITRYLVASEFHVKLLQACPKKLKEFKCRTYRNGRESATLSFEFRLEMQKDNETIKRYFIGDVVRANEDEVELRDRINFLNTVCGTKAWQRFWPLSSDVPVVLFVVEDDSKIENLVTYLRMYKIPKYFITTDERLREGLNRPVGVWKRFNEELIEIEDAKTKVFMD